MLLLYEFDIQMHDVSLRANKSVSARIESFKIINLPHDTGTPLEKNVIYVVLSVEAYNNPYYLKWFYLVDHTFVQFWIWEMKKPVKSLEYFNFNDQHKVLLSYKEPIILSNDAFSIVEIYEIKINGDLSNFR